MKSIIMRHFSSDLLSNRLEPFGFFRKGNAWFKVIPDTVLCVEVRSLRGPAFDVTFGIIPLVCIKPFELNMGCFQVQGDYSREYNDYKLKFCRELTSEIAYHGSEPLYHIESAVYNLKDERKYNVLLQYWGDVYERMIKPYIQSIKTVEEAVEAIGNYLEFRGRWDMRKHTFIHDRSYPIDYMPVFMKLGRSQEVLNCWDEFIAGRIESDEKVKKIETAANRAFKDGEYSNRFLWYWIMRNNDCEKMDIVVDELEKYGYAWLAKTQGGVKGTQHKGTVPL